MAFSSTITNIAVNWQKNVIQHLMASQVMHVLLPSLQCQYSLTNVDASATLTAQLSLCCLPPLLLTSQNGLVCTQSEAFN